MIEAINQTLTGIYLAVREQIPEQFRIYVVLVIFTLLIALYAIFMWKFYKFLARKNILELNLKQYNTTEHPFWNKFLASIFFLLEYIIIMPVAVFFWFSVFSIFLLLLSETQNANQILFISAAVVAATRIVAYYSDELAEEVVGVFPISLLVVLLLEPNFFNLQKLIERFSEIPFLLENIFAYLLFIFAIEIIVRFAFTIFDFFSNKED